MSYHSFIHQVECLEFASGVPNHQSFELRNSLNLCRTLQTKAVMHLSSSSSSVAAAAARKTTTTTTPLDASPSPASEANGSQRADQTTTTTTKQDDHQRIAGDTEPPSYLTFLSEELPRHSPLVVPLDWVQRCVCVCEALSTTNEQTR